MTRLVTSIVFAFLAALAAACGGSSVCTGNSCDCPRGQTCDFGSRAAGAHLTCEGDSMCSGSGGPGSDAACNGTTCTLVVGAGSTVACGSGTCNITCDGACTISCAGTCNITCGAGTTMGPAGCS